MSSSDEINIEKLGEARDKIITELRKSIVGMEEVIDEMLISIFAQGHCTKSFLTNTLSKNFLSS